MAELRRIGRSDLETPPLILGGNVFGWTIDEATSFAVLDAFVAGGGRMIDTADVYMAFAPGNVGGESETIIGKWLKRRGRRDDVLITTKVGMLEIDGVKGLAPAHIHKAIDASLARLGTDYVDLYLAHQDDARADQGEVAETFGALVKAGKVRTVGASNFDAARLASAIDAQERKDLARYQALQNQYNLLERADYEGAVQEYCVEHGIGMTPYYGLASGYLTGKYRTQDDLKGTRSRNARKYMESNGPAVLAGLDAVVEETGATHAQIALAWIAAQPGIAAPIASATSVKQLEDLLGAMELTLSETQLRVLNEKSRAAA
ncbi:aldo/keto reductase [Sphingomonas sp. CGMCC 1.13654]|uniref:Aldo/keto reductase n=1 Tax=Sphingomonas chungangi TaxID=2683589 RepID=A0A838L3P3_9SPHN|nr:aldo/keto reductase [Sphingomonas chungangi]MBA2933305.1 aldo/keto reductase [Sphingomonas chungangi]MVW54639.1 aldo/keto reductase [Sphingomonas chungangi]